MNGPRRTPTNRTRRPQPMRRIIPAIVLVAVLALGGGLIATTAYQAGLSTAVTTATGSGAAVAPVVVPGLRVRLRLAPVRVRLRDLRVPRHPVLPVHRLRADPRHLLARRPRSPRRLGTRRLAGWGPAGPAPRVTRAALTGRPRPTRRSRTGTAAPTASAASGPPPADRPTRPDRAVPPLPAPPDIVPGAHRALRCDR